MQKMLYKYRTKKTESFNIIPSLSEFFNTSQKKSTDEGDMHDMQPTQTDRHANQFASNKRHRNSIKTLLTYVYIQWEHNVS